MRVPSKTKDLPCPTVSTANMRDPYYYKLSYNWAGLLKIFYGLQSHQHKNLFDNRQPQGYKKIWETLIQLYCLFVMIDGLIC